MTFVDLEKITILKPRFCGVLNLFNEFIKDYGPVVTEGKVTFEGNLTFISTLPFCGWVPTPRIAGKTYTKNKPKIARRIISPIIKPTDESDPSPFPGLLITVVIKLFYI